MSKFFIFLFLFVFSLSFSSSLSAVVHVPEKYTDVNAGERFYFEVSVKYPENPQRKDLRLTYEVLNLDGELVSQSKALKAIETQASFVDFLVIPESTDSGLHTINVRIEDYELLSEEVSSSFNVKGNKLEELQVYFFILLGAIFFVGFLVVLNLKGVKKK